jgi:hypothetical protein
MLCENLAPVAGSSASIAVDMPGRSAMRLKQAKRDQNHAKRGSGTAGEPDRGHRMPAALQYLVTFYWRLTERAK